MGRVTTDTFRDWYEFGRNVGAPVRSEAVLELVVLGTQLRTATGPCPAS